MNKLYVMAVILLTLSACASDRAKHRRANMEDYLATDITQEHTKLFTYTVKMSFSGGHRMRSRGGFGGGGMEGGMGRGGMRDPEAMRQRMEDRVLQRLAEKIKQSGYCRAGYKILDKDIERGNAAIRGQCNDLANEADIKKFKTEKTAG